jgi:hypothetical protein
MKTPHRLFQFVLRKQIDILMGIWLWSNKREKRIEEHKKWK